jgi:hypothetical protein
MHSKRAAAAAAAAAAPKEKQQFCQSSPEEHSKLVLLQAFCQAGQPVWCHERAKLPQ